MEPKTWNWRLWLGFFFSLLAPFGFFFLFEITRAAFWIGLLCCVVAVTLLAGGLKRSYSAPESYRGKVAGPILAVLSLVMVGAFAFGTYMTRQAYAMARNAPVVGAKAPEFSLVDSKDSPTTLATLLSGPTPGGHAQRGVLLVFYRGYW